MERDISFIDNLKENSGYFDGYKFQDGRIVYYGWAINIFKMLDYKVIIVDSDKKIIACGTVGKTRTDVKEHFNNDEMLYSGWEVASNTDCSIPPKNPLYAYIYYESIKTAYKIPGICNLNSSTPSMFIGYKLEDLISKGLRVGKNFNLQPDCFIDYSFCWLISIGDDVIFAPRVHLIAHDASTFTHLGYVKIGLIEIGNRVFIGNNAIVLPNVKIGNDVIIGAGSVVTKNVPDNCVFAGNPAKFMCKTSDYMSKYKEMIKSSPVFPKEYAIEFGITNEQKNEMIRKLKDTNGIGFI